MKQKVANARRDLKNRRLPRDIRDLLDSPPQRGDGLNNWFFRLARVLHPYRTPAAIVRLLAAATAGEPVKPGEIERAVKNSGATAWHPGQRLAPARVRAWPAVNRERREAITGTGYGLADLRKASPVRFEDSESHAEQIVDALFPGNPLLCVGRSSYQFATRTREEWRGRLAKMQFIVPSRMIARKGRTKDGKESAHALENTGPRDFLVIEQDAGTADEQSAVLLHLAKRAPLTLAVHSGGKSIHGWFFATGQTEDRLRDFMRYAVALGADRATWTRSQFVRMPDGRRDNGKRQTVFFFKPDSLK